MPYASERLLIPIFVRPAYAKAYTKTLGLAYTVLARAHLAHACGLADAVRAGVPHGAGDGGGQQQARRVHGGEGALRPARPGQSG